MRWRPNEFDALRLLAEAGTKMAKALKGVITVDRIFTKLSWLFTAVDIFVAINQYFAEKEQHQELIDTIHDLAAARFQLKHLALESESVPSLWDDIQKEVTLSSTTASIPMEGKSPDVIKALEEFQATQYASVVKKHFDAFDEREKKITDTEVWSQLVPRDTGFYTDADLSHEEIKNILKQWAVDAEHDKQ